MNTKTVNFKLFFLLAAVIAVFALFIFIVVFSLFMSHSQSTVDNNSKNVIKSVFPPDGEVLTPRVKQKFYVYFNSPPTNKLTYTLSYVDIGADDNNPISVGTDVSDVDKGGTIITTLTNLTENSVYFLKIIDSATHKTIFSASYFTADITPTPIPSNNPLLIPFLPHQELNYSLEYLKDQNLYIFHFIYNPDSTDSIDDQFNNAKNNALQFIKDKGIDPNALTIDWRNS